MEIVCMILPTVSCVFMIQAYRWRHHRPLLNLKRRRAPKKVVPGLSPTKLAKPIPLRPTLKVHRSISDVSETSFVNRITDTNDKIAISNTNVSGLSLGVVDQNETKLDIPIQAIVKVQRRTSQSSFHRDPDSVRGWRSWTYVRDFSEGSRTPDFNGEAGKRSGDDAMSMKSWELRISST